MGGYILISRTAVCEPALISFSERLISCAVTFASTFDDLEASFGTENRFFAEPRFALLPFFFFGIRPSLNRKCIGRSDIVLQDVDNEDHYGVVLNSFNENCQGSVPGGNRPVIKKIHPLVVMGRQRFFQKGDSLAHRLVQAGIGVAAFDL